MAIHLADKFSTKVAERFNKKSIIAGIASKAYDWDGVESIKVYSVDTVPLTDYTRSGMNRFGTPTELGDSVQTMKVTVDKAFTYTVDKGNNAEQYNVKSANRNLQREIDEVVVPFCDELGLKKWTAGAGSVVKAAESVSASNIVSEISKVKYKLDQAKVSKKGRYLICSNEYLNYVVNASQFVYTDKLANKAMVEGEIGTLMGFTIVECLDEYLPTGVGMLAVHSDAVLAPFKLRDYKIHIDPPGLNGDLTEGRILTDAFVLDAKAGAVCPYASAGNVAGNATIAVNVNATNPIQIGFSGDEVLYTLDGSDPRCSGTAVHANANVTLNAAQANGATMVKAVVYDANKSVCYGEMAKKAFA